MRILANPGRGPISPVGVSRSDDGWRPIDFHRRLPGYEPTPLIDAAAMAAERGLGALWIKDESSRLGLPAFKVLGASWAIYRLLRSRLGRVPDWSTVDELRAALAPLGALTLCTATDGNHGRAVAWMARLLGYDACIFVPAGTVVARIEGIQSEGARVTVVDGTYDDAVDRAAEQASDDVLVVSDTSWDGLPRRSRLGRRGLLDDLRRGRRRVSRGTRRRDGPGRCGLSGGCGRGPLRRTVADSRGGADERGVRPALG